MPIFVKLDAVFSPGGAPSCFRRKPFSNLWESTHFKRLFGYAGEELRDVAMAKKFTAGGLTFFILVLWDRPQGHGPKVFLTHVSP